MLASFVKFHQLHYRGNIDLLLFLYEDKSTRDESSQRQILVFLTPWRNLALIYHALRGVSVLTTLAQSGLGRLFHPNLVVLDWLEVDPSARQLWKVPESHTTSCAKLCE